MCASRLSYKKINVPLKYKEKCFSSKLLSDNRNALKIRGKFPIKIATQYYYLVYFSIEINLLLKRNFQ